MAKKIRVKPGKGQSMVGFFGGIVFVLIGVFVVIPIFSWFGVLWTLFAVVITAVNGINAFGKKGIVSHEIIVDEEEQSEDPEKRLEKLRGLYEERLITKEEYEKRRQEIIDEI